VREITARATRVSPQTGAGQLHYAITTIASAGAAVVDHGGRAYASLGPSPNDLAFLRFAA
jgi:hypothetical protein